MKPIRHLTVRVAWHDQRWNGAICRAPSRNSYCVALDRIRISRDDGAEDARSGTDFADLSADGLPPSKAESGAFMNEREWMRTFKHPYKEIEKCAATHGHLRDKTVVVPEFSTFVVPFAWMLQGGQDAIDAAMPQALPPDRKAPFENSPWVFGRERQFALGEHFFGQLTEESSLAFFYCKEGQPLGDTIPRLLMGLGRILKVGKPLQYESATNEPYPLWDRVISHSIRPTGSDGFLLPYHDYLASTGDPAEDARRLDLMREIAVQPPPAHVRDFSYAGELTKPGVALAMLTRCLDAVRKIRAHEIAPGDWQKREEWINAQISRAWRDRGAFPGLGSALETEH